MPFPDFLTKSITSMNPSGELVSLTKAQVPNYLVGSDFYNSLSADDEEEFSIPRKFLKPTENVTSGAELAHLFHTMKFWGLMRLPSNIIELLIFKSVVIPDCEKRPINDVLVEFDAEFKLSRLHKTLPICNTKKQRVDSAAQCGREDVLEHSIRVDGQVNAVVIKAAAEHGFLNLLQRIIRAYTPNPGAWSFSKVSTATVAGRGHVECLHYLLKNDCKKENNTCGAAAENGHLACLKVAREHGCVWNHGVVDMAAMHGHLDCLIYAMEHSNAAAEETAGTAILAAEHGQVECLQYLLDQGVVPTKRMCYAACKRDNSLPCLKLLRARGAPWDVSCSHYATTNGSVACLQFLLDEGCKMDSSVALEAVKHGHDQCLEILLVAGCVGTPECVNCAALGGHVACVKVLRKYMVGMRNGQVCDAVLHNVAKRGTAFIRALFEGGYSIPQWALATVAQNGDVECVEYICANRCCKLTADVTVAAALTYHSAAILKVLQRYGCPWNEAVCERTARNDDIGGLTFAHAHGCPWDASTTTAALGGRCRQCVEYALLHDCPFSDDACDLAAKCGWLDILQLLHERGCPLTLETCIAAATHKYGDCLTYAVTHGAPVDESICVAAVKYQYDPYVRPAPCNKLDPLRMLKCAHDLGCPWDERTILAAIRTMVPACLEYALQHGCPCSANVCELAAIKGRNKLLQTLHKYDCPWDERTCAAAAEHTTGLACLQYARQNGCPWDASTTTAAARAGLLRNLAYALHCGCPCDAGTSLAAAKRGDLRALQLLRAHGCPWDQRVSQAATVSGSASCLRYCVEQGCPISKTTMKMYNNRRNKPTFSTAGVI